MKTSGIIFMVLGFGVAAGCAPPAVPNRPSWDVDVFPILQGSCNHCHGETVGRLTAQPAGRLDICDPQVFVDAGIPQAAAWLGAKLEANTFPAFIKANMNPRATMPPPPAAELSDYERDILLKWGADNRADKCNKQGRNREPAMRLIGEPVWDGNDLKLQLEVWDPDMDTVIGKVTVGTMTALIPAAGRREIVVTGANRNDPITVLLHDGFVARTIEL
jgi:hypothetical protein